MEKYTCYASCAFGIEGILAEELRRLGFADVAARDARVYFSADMGGVARANLYLRTADRVYIVLGEFDAVTFDELFEGVRRIPFGELLPSDARFPVDGNAVRSELMSVSDIQSVSKKAVVRALQRKYDIQQFEETGNVFNIYVNLYQNRVTVALNTSGAGLNRRGYRMKNVQAPLRETLAAALLLIARWYSRDLYDPMCGSGTIVVEAAMMAANMAPGLKRRFDAQGYGNAWKKAFSDARAQAEALVHAPAMELVGTDIDGANVKLAKEHAHNMGVDEYIRFGRADIADFTQPPAPAIVVTNPPYAVRLGEQKAVHALYRSMGRVLGHLDDTKVFVLSASDDFSQLYGKKPDKKRKLYNGNLRCTYYQYYKKDK